MTVHIGEATRWQAGQLWDRFYGKTDPNGVWKWQFLNKLERLGIIAAQGDVKTRPKRPTTTAALQGLFLYYKQDMLAAIAKAGQLLPDETSYEDQP
jgi:chaperone BCS1